MDADEELSASWQANATAWTELVRAGGIESRRLITDRAILEAALALQPRRALDLGCGEGWLVRALTDKGVHAVGVDGSAELIAAASKAGPESYHCLDYQALSQDPESIGTDYDLIIANFALLDQGPGPLLTALKSIVARPGRLLIQTLHPQSQPGPYRDGWRQEDFAAFGQAKWTPMPWYFRTLSSWLILLEACGWQLEHLEEPLHPVTERPASLLLQARAS